MRKTLILLIFIPFIGNTKDYGNVNHVPFINSYKELNSGLYINDGITFPGASFLWGNTRYYKNTTFFDYQYGLALPTVITGKVGFGIGNKDRTVGISLGFRPWPSTIYLQLHIKSKLILSIEPLIGLTPNAFNTGSAII